MNQAKLNIHVDVSCFFFNNNNTLLLCSSTVIYWRRPTSSKQQKNIVGRNWKILKNRETNWIQKLKRCIILWEKTEIKKYVKNKTKKHGTKKISSRVNKASWVLNGGRVSIGHVEICFIFLVYLTLRYIPICEH